MAREIDFVEAGFARRNVLRVSDKPFLRCHWRTTPDPRSHVRQYDGEFYHMRAFWIFDLYHMRGRISPYLYFLGALKFDNVTSESLKIFPTNSPPPPHPLFLILSLT